MSAEFNITEAEKRLNYTFKDKSLLRLAFTHSSYSNENNVQCNEQLEFLGDSVVNFVIAEYLYKTYPELDAGQLTRYRSRVVSARPLSQAAEDLSLTGMLMLGEGERRHGQRSIGVCSDLFESVVAAIYLDGGMDNARRFIIGALIAHLGRAKRDTDYKSQLSEYNQKVLKKSITYKSVTKTGPPHNPMFTVLVTVGGQALAGPQTAESKKAAEQLAAKETLKVLKAEMSN